MSLLFYLLFMILIIVLFLYIYAYQEHFNTQINLTWNFPSNLCESIVAPVYLDLFHKYNIKKVSIFGDIIIPCSYDDIDKEIEQIHPNSHPKYVHLISNSDELCAKDSLCKNIVNKYGRTNQITPKSWTLNNSHDRNMLSSEYDKNKLYILKKNIQQQQGLLIVDSLEKIISSATKGYVVAQELLQDPFLINGRKINMRFYVLLTSHFGIKNAYVFNDGFMYYTPKFFKQNSTEIDENITTGYIDRTVYDENPLTHNDFKKYLIKHKFDSDKIFSDINEAIKNTLFAMIDKLGTSSKLNDLMCFQLYGFDIALSESLNVNIMEANKGPDVGSKDKRDGAVKIKCVNDMFQVVGVIPKTENNGFIKII